MSLSKQGTASASSTPPCTNLALELKRLQEKKQPWRTWELNNELLWIDPIVCSSRPWFRMSKVFHGLLVDSFSRNIRVAPLVKTIMDLYLKPPLICSSLNLFMKIIASDPRGNSHYWFKIVLISLHRREVFLHFKKLARFGFIY